MVVVSVLSHAVGCGAWAFYVGFVLGLAVALLGLAAARNEESVTLVVSEKVGLWLKLVDTLLCVCDLKTRLSPITRVARWLRLVRMCKVKAVLSSYAHSYGTMTGPSPTKLKMRTKITHMCVEYITETKKLNVNADVYAVVLREAFGKNIDNQTESQLMNSFFKEYKDVPGIGFPSISTTAMSKRLRKPKPKKAVAWHLMVPALPPVMSPARK